MSNKWREAKFGEFLKPNSRPYTLRADEDANLVGMRLYGFGPFHRELKPAMRIAKKSHFVIRSGDVIYNKLFAWRGTFGIVPPELDGMFVSDKFPTYELDRTQVIDDWLKWFFRHPAVWEQARAMSTGSAALSKLTLNPPRFLHLTMPLPPIDEQRRIIARVEELAARIQDVRTLRGKAIEESEALGKSYLGRLFGDFYNHVTGSLRIDNWRRLDSVVDDVADGPHITPTYVSSGIPFITVLNITSGRIRFGDHKYITPEDHAQFQRRAKAECGDVLISKDGTIGVPCYVDTERDFSFFVSVALVKPKKNILDGQFLAWALRTPYLQERMAARSRGDMIRHLVLREIRDLTVPIPPIEQQRQIVAELERMQGALDKMGLQQSETACEIDALMPSILSKAFAGEL